MLVKDVVFKVVSEIIEVPVDELTVETGIGDYAKWDSLGHLNILQTVRDELEIEIEPEEFIEIENIEDIIEIAEKKVNKE